LVAKNYYEITDEDWEKMTPYQQQSYADEMVESGKWKGVPDAPYKKTWHELGWKRAFMEALRDPSIERLTWTTGDVQADRYNLAQYIDSIEAYSGDLGEGFATAEDGTTYYIGGTDAEGNWFIYKQMPDDAQGNWVDDVKMETPGSLESAREALKNYAKPSDSFNIKVQYKEGKSENFTDITPDILSDIVGKEMAEKIVNDEGGTYSGLDLEIGGEWHKQHYDQKVSQFVKRFLKQFGVGPQRYKPGEWEVFDARTGDPYRYFDTEKQANDFIDKRRNIDDAGSANKFLDYEKAKGDFWKINITPEMRETYEGGVPLAMREDEEGLLGRYA